MLKINFYTDSEEDEIQNAAKVYQAIWNKEGEQIVKTIKNHTNLSFLGNELEALVYNGRPRSLPLSFSYKYKSTGKRASMIHELLHKLFYDNKVDTNEVGQDPLKSHKILDLVLYDIWESAYNKEFADFALGIEKSYNQLFYNEAWDWALSMTKEERAAEFKKLVERSKRA